MQNSSERKSRKGLIKIHESLIPAPATVIAIMIMTVLSLSLPRTARAGSGKIFLETIGISTAMGTVLGASTLPFYDQPGNHLMNLVYGASIGAVAGVGLGLYQWLSGRSEREHEIFGERALPADDYPRSVPLSAYASSSSSSLSGRIAPEQKAIGFARSSVLLWTPLVSLNW